MSKIKSWAIAHKLISGIILVAIGWGVYAWYGAVTKPMAVTKYVVQDATQGTVISSVSGSGQVQAASQVDVKAQVSEPVTKIYVRVGQHVTAGELLMQLDTTNEAKALKQAQLSLQSAQLSLAKLQEAPATTTLSQDQDALTQAQQSVVLASTTLARDYQTGFDTLGNSFVDFQIVMAGLNDFVAGTEVNKLQNNPDALVNLMPSYLQASTQPYDTALRAQYALAVAAYQQNLADYHAATRNSSSATLDSVFTETYNTAKDISDAVKAAKDLLTYVTTNYPTSQGFIALPGAVNTFQTSLGNYTTTMGNDVSSVSNIVTTITGDETSITNDQLSLNEKQATLVALQAGPDSLDVQSQGISIENSQLSLQTAEQNLAYDSVRAPIDGTVSAIASVVGETVASPAASIVSDGKLAQVTLNEVDAAKVNLNDKATLSFDAISGLSLAGAVVEIDPVGTVSQGVVNYNAQINFTQPTNTSSELTVKPGMSVTANIVTQADQNVLAVPNGAVHTSGGASYVLEPATPLSASDVTASQSGGIILSGGTKMVPVTLGLANDTQTEITSGLNAGDQIITQTMQSTASTAATGGTSALRLLGGGAAGGVGGGAAGGGTFRGGAGGAGTVRTGG